jgi:hypothetical protein
LKKLAIKALAKELERGEFARRVEVAPWRTDFWTRLGGRTAQVLVTDGVDEQVPTVGKGGKEKMIHRVSAATFVLIVERSKKGHRWEILYLCFLQKDRINARSFAYELRNFNIIDGHHGHRRLEQLVKQLIET